MSLDFLKDQLAKQRSSVSKSQAGKYFKAQGLTEEQAIKNIQMGIKPPKTQSVQLEDDIQKTVTDWLDLMGILWIHPPFELFRPGQWREYHKGVKTGKGFPDLLVLLPAPIHPVYIEFKKPGGKTRPDQVEWQRKLNLLYPGRVLQTDNAEEAIEFIERFLKNNKN